MTHINFQLAKHEKVTLEIYNITGQRVATLVNSELKAGNYTVEWNAQQFASGIYFYQLKAGSFIQTKKMILVK